MILLTSTQGLVLEYIRQSCAAGMPPCIGDICVGVDMSFTTVSRAARLLYGFGLITRTRACHRDGYSFAPVADPEDVMTEEAYHETRREVQHYPPCTGIAINQEPIYPMMRER